MYIKHFNNPHTSVFSMFQNKIAGINKIKKNITMKLLLYYIFWDSYLSCFCATVPKEFSHALQFT